MDYKMDNKQYLNPQWQKKRLEILERDEWCCQKCSDTKQTLHIHHRYYTKGKKIWDYPNEAFITLCKDCHKEETDYRKEVEATLLDALRRKFLYSEVHDLAVAIGGMQFSYVPEVVAGAICWAMVNPKIQSDLIKRYFSHLQKQNNATHKTKSTA